ncbi:1-deoxy-D-xylulose-5-phosphate synthase [Streptomyces sp. NPDC056480]|uniref:1-deoxy-D-xylulose-5-phosphate synthase n=1 Tax=Streptomyces sp. NPDC056480 TaxID=3345833 RepID=UPI00367C2169
MATTPQAHPSRVSLAGLDGLETVRSLPPQELPALADRIRSFLVAQVCQTGGHLGPNLGVVELTIALHRVFTSPHDALVFDTGHQAYVHKILTGRHDEFGSLRQLGGLSGYPSRAESVHDWVDNSHASTALSYADGLAKARRLSKERDREVVAVIGDGALTGGMAWEALNNLGGAGDRPVIVVLNDNGRSYAPTTGAVAGHLAELKLHPEGTQNLFEALGFSYVGPIDGHNIAEVEGALRTARALRCPALVHVVTVKGKGYPPAESDEADCLHAVGVIDPGTGKAMRPAASPAVSWTSVFAHELMELAEQRDDLVAVTAAMTRPTGLHLMAEKFPDRVFDVGIAEQHAVTSAAGLAMGGYHPVVAIYATFLNRAFDQVLMDVALHRLPVTFVLDRAGITGPDGPSHHGMWDLSLLTAVPGMQIALPRDADHLRRLLREAVAVSGGPTMLRFPRGATGPSIPAVARMDGIDILHLSRRSPDVLLISAGPLAESALKAATLLEEHGLGVTVADADWVHPVSEALTSMAARHRVVVTVEDGVRTGGIGSAIAQAVQDAAIATPVTTLGLPRDFIAQGNRAAVLSGVGLDGPGIAHAILRSTSCPASLAKPSRIKDLR